MEKAQKLNITILQSSITWEDAEANRKQFEAKINTIKNKTDLIILPEMFTTGFTMNAAKFAETMSGETISWMQKIALKKQTAITGSLIIEDNNNFYNRLVFVNPVGKIDFYDKRHSFTLAKEDETYVSGTKKLIIEYKGWKICPLICYDLRFPVWSRNTEHYDLLLYIASWPKKRIYAWDNLLKARAIENISYTIGVNRIGKDANNFDHNGHSIALNYLGMPLSEENKESETIIQVSLDKQKQDTTRKKLGFLKDKDFFYF